MVPLVFLFYTGAISYPFEVTVNVSPMDISLVLTRALVTNALTVDGVNQLDASIGFTEGVTTASNTIDYSALSSLVAGLQTDSARYPVGTTRHIAFGTELVPAISVSGNMFSLVNPDAMSGDSDFLHFIGLAPATVGTYPGAVSLSLIGQGNFTGSVAAEPGTLTVLETADVSGDLTYTAISTPFGTAANATPSGITRGTGTLTYTITSTAVAGIDIDSTTGEITVADNTAIGTYTVDVSVISDVDDSTAITGSVTVTVNPVDVSGDLTYTAISTTFWNSCKCDSKWYRRWNGNLDLHYH